MTAYDALERLTGEPVRAHAAFLDYVRMGDGRSLRGLLARYRELYGEKRLQSAHKPPTLRLKTLADWSIRYRWQKRLADYQAECQRREQALWEQHRRAVREADWALGQALRERAAQLLAEADNWSIGDILRALELASRLQRLAAEVPPPGQTHDVTVTAPTPIAFVRMGGQTTDEDDAL